MEYNFTRVRVITIRFEFGLCLAKLKINGAILLFIIIN